MLNSSLVTPRASALSLIIISLLSSPLATKAEILATKDLDAVIVTAAPISPLTYETDTKLPRQPVPASDGADYLKTIPGFTALRNGGTNGDPVLRGMFGSRLNLLTNDGSMPGACPGRMDNPMSYVSPETFDRLIVIKGPQSVVWGPGASAGTVRFERETPRFDQPGFELAGSLLGGAFGRNDQVLDATGGAPKGYARVSANRSASDDYEDGNGIRVPSSWKKWNADAALGWTPNTDTLFELNAGVGDGQARYAGRGMDGAQFKRQSYTARFEKFNLPGALDRVEASLFYNYADHIMDNYTLREPNPMSAMPMPMVANVDRRTFGGRNAWVWVWDRVEFTAGVDGQQSRHRERSGMGRDAHKSVPWAKDATFDTMGVFLEGLWTVAQETRFVAGTRVDRAGVQDHRPIAGMMNMPNPTYGKKRHEVLPAGFVRLEKDGKSRPVTWYVGLGHTERMPDYRELFSPGAGPTGSLNAFSGIQPERTTQLDTGFQYHTQKFDIWASAYIGRVQDFILFSYQGGGMMGMTSSAANVDADIRGGEAGAEYRFNDHWKVGGTLAVAWGQNRSSGEALPQMPPLDARLTAAYDNQRWSFGALFRAVRKQDRVAIDQGNVVGRDFGSSAGFATLALSGGYRFTDKVQLTAGVDNLFDRDFSEHLNLSGSADFGYPADPVRINEAGRTAWLKLNFAY